MSSRSATHAGSWYSNDRAKLAGELAGWLDEAQVTCGRARAIIAPHAGYSYSGPTAAWAYKHINPTGIQRVFLLGPSHHVHSSRCLLTACTEYSTPLGPLQVDQQASDALRQTGLFDDMPRKTDEDEHSLEMHLPYLFTVMQGQSFTLVPVLVGALSEANEAVYGALFAEHLANPENLFVISSDFCHWGRRFRFTPFGNCGPDIHRSIEELDHQGMALVEAQDAAGFAAYQREHGNTICGQHPIAVLLHALQARQRLALVSSRPVHMDPSFRVGTQACTSVTHKVKFVRYAMSSLCRSINDSSVSYASAVVSC